MNYIQIYKDLVISRKNGILIKGEYYEKHHITPKCLGGKDKGIVNFTFREHFIAHWLLTKMFKDKIINRKMLHAFSYMVSNGSGRRNLTSLQYESARKAFSKARKGKTHTKESKRKMSKSSKGKISSFKNKTHTKESKRKMSAAKKDKYIGKNNPMYGRKHSEETRSKISKKCKANNPKARIWTFIYSGNEITIKSLRNWCKENNYKYSLAKYRANRNIPL